MKEIMLIILAIFGLSFLGTGIQAIVVGKNVISKISNIEELNRRLRKAKRLLVAGVVVFLVITLSRPLGAIWFDGSLSLRMVGAGLSFLTAFFVVLEVIEISHLADALVKISMSTKDRSSGYSLEEMQ